jgi:hypothetical protein
MKKIKKEKLNFEKSNVLELNDLKMIKGGKDTDLIEWTVLIGGSTRDCKP